MSFACLMPKISEMVSVMGKVSSAKMRLQQAKERGPTVTILPAVIMVAQRATTTMRLRKR